MSQLDYSQSSRTRADLLGVSVEDYPEEVWQTSIDRNITPQEAVVYLSNSQITYADEVLPPVSTHSRNRLPDGSKRLIADRQEWQFSESIPTEVYQGRLPDYAQTIDDNGRTIAIQPNGNRVRNHAFAGRNWSFDDVNHEGMVELYPDGVDFDLQGFPIFDPYVARSQPIPNMVGGQTDIDTAERLAFPNGRPEHLQDYTWHHLQDGETMQLVPTDLHAAVTHTGGESIIGWRPE